MLTHHYLQGYFALVICYHLQSSKNAPTKNGPPRFGSILCEATMARVFFLFTHHSGNSFLCFVSKCEQMYRLLPHHYGQGIFALVICSVTSIDALSLGIALSQARYSLVRDSYHQEYS